MSIDSRPTVERMQSRRFDEMEELKEHRGDTQQQQNFHVLAVDDSVIDRKLLEKLLTISSYHVTCVESGSKALEYLGLPDNLDSSPSSTTQRQRQSSWKNVPVIVMSSENVPSRINRCLEEGAEEFLLKPVQLSDMKRLHPHLSKSLNSTLKEKNNSSSTSSCAINNDSSTHNLTNDTNHHHLLQNIKENNTSGNTASNKRKAMSSPTDEIIVPDQCVGLATV